MFLLAEMGKDLGLFFAKHWKGLLLLGMLAATVFSIWFYLNGLYSTIDAQAKQVTELTAANKVLTDNNEKLTVALNASNQSIKALADGADQTKKAFNGLSTTVKTQTATLDSRLKSILTEKKPVTCEDTILYLLRAAKEYQK